MNAPVTEAVNVPYIINSAPYLLHPLQYICCSTHWVKGSVRHRLFASLSQGYQHSHCHCPSTMQTCPKCVHNFQTSNKEKKSVATVEGCSQSDRASKVLTFPRLHCCFETRTYLLCKYIDTKLISLAGKLSGRYCSWMSCSGAFTNTWMIFGLCHTLTQVQRGPFLWQRRQVDHLIQSLSLWQNVLGETSSWVFLAVFVHIPGSHKAPGSCLESRFQRDRGHWWTHTQNTWERGRRVL